MARFLLLIMAAALLAAVSAEDFVVRPGQRFVIELAETPVGTPLAAPPPTVEAPTPQAEAPTPEGEAPGPGLASPPSPPAPAPGTPSGLAPGPGGSTTPGSSAIARTVALGSIAAALLFSLFA